MGFLKGRVIAWLVLGGGGLALITALYSGAILRGKSTERAAWERSTVQRTKQVRDANHHLNEITLESNRELRRQEETIKNRWDIKPEHAEVKPND